MSYLFDTNTLLRLAEKNNPLRPVVLDAIRKIRKQGDMIYYTPQIFSEFWNVCTRPTSARGGLGLSVEQAEWKVSLIEKHFVLAPDSLATFTEWRKLISSHKIVGVQVHDAKIAASMIVHKIDFLVTFNTKDFTRFNSVSVIEPKDL